MMWRKRSVRVLGLAALIAGGALYQGSCVRGLATVNPCGTILSTSVCDPAVYEQLFGDYYQPDFSADPTCIIPFQCTGG